MVLRLVEDLLSDRSLAGVCLRSVPPKFFRRAGLLSLYDSPAPTRGKESSWGARKVRRCAALRQGRPSHRYRRKRCVGSDQITGRRCICPCHFSRDVTYSPRILKPQGTPALLSAQALGSSRNGSSDDTASLDRQHPNRKPRSELRAIVMQPTHDQPTRSSARNTPSAERTRAGHAPLTIPYVE
ncbi:uncharacterized protein PHACADRAFT_257903 [Phanerochaete carnosa HHB-10118-sp]|uniref:Uncharacterized protein n=1 Tax=Phanerochaete carnosa (strain HHB-10118-sp) TaxID=650164 RepID=K5VRT5_PHACS|nr:uncharacterized protein PHACADRAFT_257903 [Phanerochaete carnosa HHB-10118-sp]EKM54213.1 hypothetical protein PHACADRAFT_257903 [Phanerochaete carnosa HHB-10118-sp]